MEFNLADSINSAGLSGGSKKMQKENAVGEPGQLMLFAPMIDQASHIAKQGEATMVEHGKTGVNELTDPEMKIFHKEIPSKGVVPGSLKSGSLKPGLNNLGIESGSLKPELTNAVVGKDEANKKSRGAVGKYGSGKNEIGNLLKNSGLKGEKAIVEHGKTVINELTDHKTKILHKEIPSKGVVPGSLKSGSLKPGLNNLGIESGSLKPELTNAVVGKDEANKKSRGAVGKDGGGKDGIENLLKNPDLKSEKTIVEHGKTGVKEFIDPKIKILHKEMPSSARLVDKISSVGGYPNATFHAGSSTAAVNASVNYNGIEPRALISQIANGVNRAGRVKIVLTPPHLGTLDMDVIVRNNKVHIILQTENNDVRHTLQSNMETLKIALRSQGLIADNIIVIIQEKSDSTDYSGFGRNETLFKEDNNQKENKEDQRGKMDSLGHAPSLFDEENPHVRIDGRISLFA